MCMIHINSKISKLHIKKYKTAVHIKQTLQCRSNCSDVKEDLKLGYNSFTR